MYPYIQILGRSFSSYGICMAVAALLVGFLAYRRANFWGITGEDVLIVGATGCGAGLLLGGLLYVVVTFPLTTILEFLREGRMGELFGGIVFYGGLIGGILGGIIGTKLAKCSAEKVAGAIIVYFPLGHAAGRVGCLLAGCCHGFAYDGPLAVYYPHAVTGLSPSQGYFPVQPLESVVNVAIFLRLRTLAQKGKRGSDVLVAYLMSYSVMRFLLEFLRGDAVRGIYWQISLSQWISVGLLAFCGIYWCVLRKRLQPSEKTTDALTK